MLISKRIRHSFTIVAICLLIVLSAIFCLVFSNSKSVVAENIGGGFIEQPYHLSGTWDRLDYKGADELDFNRNYGQKYNSDTRGDLEKYFNPYLKVGVSATTGKDSNKWLDLSQVHKIDKNNVLKFFEFILPIADNGNLRNKLYQMRVYRDNTLVRSMGEDKWSTSARTLALLSYEDLKTGTYRFEADFIFDGGVSGNHWGEGYVSYSYKSDDIKIDIDGPTISVETVSGRYLNEYDSTNENVVISASDTFGVSEISVNGYKLANGETLITGTRGYTVTATDTVGNSSTFKFNGDKTPPTGQLVGVTSGGHTNSNVTFTWNEGGCRAEYTKDSGAIKDYAKGTALSSDGQYEIFLYDINENVQTYAFIIDKTEMNINNGSIVGAFKDSDGVYYINKDITATVTEPNIEKVRYRRAGVDANGNDYPYIESALGAFRIYADGQNIGEWQLCFIDWCGNVSNPMSVVLQIETDFGNLDRIRDSYKINYYYRVNLPGYIFGIMGKPNIAKMYAFENYESALKWCVAREKEYRVQKIGTAWIYVSATNESVGQSYTDIAQLNQVVEKYAKRYISNRMIYKNAEIDYGIIMSNDGTPTPDFFSRQNITAPNFLDKYKGLPIYQMRRDFSFKIDGKFMSQTKIVVQYVANDFGEISNAKKIKVAYSKSMGENIAFAGEEVLQGYYLIEESDLCGNIQRYLVYIKNAPPKVDAVVTYGDERQESIIFSADKAEELFGKHYYIAFDIKSIIDDLDGFLGMKIVGGKLNDYYIQSDELPCLSYLETGGGKFEITVYDRSGNILLLEIFIASKPPSWSYTSLKPTAKQLSIYFALNDTHNAIKDLNIFKVKGNGDKEQLFEDSNGLAINIMSLSYVFTGGGKYTAEIVDLYGRTIKFDAIFFQKGLPNGVLSVEDNESTNKTVTFQYYSGSELIVYVINGDSREQLPKSSYLEDYDSKTQKTTVTFLNNLTNNNIYLLYLYSTADNELFIEYTFEIDTIIAEFRINDLNGNKIEQNGATNTGITFEWSEDGVNVRYNRSGEFSTTYRRGDRIVGNGLYTFEIKDRVGNLVSFTLLIDNVVDYTIVGNYKNFYGAIVTNDKILINVKETIAEFSVKSKLGFQFGNGEKILFEDVYEVTIIDNYGNKIVLIITVDFTAPGCTLSGLQLGNASKDGVTVEFENGASASLYDGANKFIKFLTNGEKITGHGAYEVRVEDIAGNKSVKTFDIDVKVEYTSDVINHQMTTGATTFIVGEEVSEFKVLLNGSAIEKSNSYSAVGHYKFIIRDKIGNTQEFEFYILPKVAQTQELKYNDLDSRIISCIKDGAAYEFKDKLLSENGKYVLKIYDSEQDKEYEITLTVDSAPPTCEVIFKKNFAYLDNFTKPNCTVKLYKNGAEIEYKEDMQIKDVGKYKIVMTDDVGNTSEMEFEIKFKLSAWSIVLIGIVIVLSIVIAVIVIRARKIKAS